MIRTSRRRMLTYEQVPPSTLLLPETAARDKAKNIFVICGPAGCGKTTIAKALFQEYGFPFVESDDYHSKANNEKLILGLPLCDTDKWDWLIAVREAALEKLAIECSTVIVDCSTLKRKYRDVLRVAGVDNKHVQVHFVLLNAAEQILRDRIATRKGHYITAGVVRRQVDELEMPSPNEHDVYILDGNGTIEQVKSRAILLVRQLMKDEK
ncbi:uncharacterized protein PV09_03938 [Verruconis gallopava]|uniref:Gluconokinase n=1 Tax=Verruconis gallopava TaxID=253628 RepID=A0A0D2AEL5_9PEZI|nr:uncharacterized protein PV09_03938 [Verruconis gallopava]KIW05428.1 hypothetical protein PV09_03938 [Verruconis gallopava]